MNTKLITALRTAASAIESDTFAYDWKRSSSCNCGLLACSILGVSASQLWEFIVKEKLNITDGPLQGSWQGMVGRHCPITGVPEPLLFKHLFRYGISSRDLIDLELLRSPGILARLGVKKLEVDNRFHLVQYLRAWSDLLTEQGADDVVREPSQQSAIA